MPACLDLHIRAGGALPEPEPPNAQKKLKGGEGEEGGRGERKRGREGERENAREGRREEEEEKGRERGKGERERMPEEREREIYLSGRRGNLGKGILERGKKLNKKWGCGEDFSGY